MFTYIPVDPIHGEMIQFWDNTTLGGGILQHWSWTFGDNTSSIEQYPKHSYINIGSYMVQLNVTDINGKKKLNNKKM
jgi:PKD repeat protein